MTDKTVNAELVPTQVNAEVIITQAIEKNVPVETMERLLAMRRELKAEYAKEEFDKAMARFQASCPTIQKTKKVSFNTTHYSYAPLEDIVEQVKELLAENGFSYTFDTKQSENAMIIYCKVKHTLGHSEVSEFQMEIDTSAKMNVSQKYGSASTYGKRYAFCNAFGILTGDEDTDVNVHLPMTPRQMAETKETPVNGNGNGYKVTEKQLNFIKRLFIQKGFTKTMMNELLESYNITEFGQLTGTQASQVIEQILAMKDRENHE